MSDIYFPFLRTLYHLRWFAIAGQLITVMVALFFLRLPLTWPPLFFGIAALVVFNGWVFFYRLQRSHPYPIHAFEVFIHMAVDVSVLTWMILWSGGITNPFGSLFLLPIALATLVLPLRWVLATTALCCFGYLISSLYGHALPHIHGLLGDAFDLHLWGMAINFLLSVGVVVYFLMRLVKMLREREHDIVQLSEQFTRNEGIVALATHAASVAHELNTPLGSLTLILEHLQSNPIDQNALPKDLTLMRSLVDLCSTRVRQLVIDANTEDTTTSFLHEYVNDLIDRWQLIRPMVDVKREINIPTVQPFHIPSAVGHLLQVLLNNAADASLLNKSHQVDVTFSLDNNGLSGSIRDYGPGFDIPHRVPLPGKLFHTTKPGGMGIGLALSHATIERLGGTLMLEPAQSTGVRVVFTIPLSYPL